MLLFGLFFSCKPSKESVVKKHEVDEFVQRLIHDQNLEVMKSSWPTVDQLKKIFKGDQTVEVMKQYSIRRKKQLPQMNGDIMKPSKDDTKIEIVSITQEDIDASNFGPFHKLNSNLVGKLKNGVTMYGINYIKADGSKEKFRSGIFNVDGQWVFIPYPAQAFRSNNLKLDPSKMKVRKISKK